MRVSVRAQLDRAAAAFESSTASLEVQREAYDASVTRLNQNLERISDIQLAIGKLQAENVTLVSFYVQFRQDVETD